MSEYVIKKRKRGRKSISKSNARTINKTITLYQKHFDIIEKNGFELSVFVRWLIDNKRDDYLEQKDLIEEQRGNSEVTTVSIYPSDLTNLHNINNFSSFIRWGLDNYSKEYKDEEDKRFI